MLHWQADPQAITGSADFDGPANIDSCLQRGRMLLDTVADLAMSNL